MSEIHFDYYNFIESQQVNLGFLVFYFLEVFRSDPKYLKALFTGFDTGEADRLTLSVALKERSRRLNNYELMTIKNSLKSILNALEAMSGNYIYHDILNELYQNIIYIEQIRELKEFSEG